MLADTEEENHDAIYFFESLGFSLRGKHVWLAKTLRRSKIEKITRRSKGIA